jgi:nucleoside-diphosphate-sugar epimerase
MKVIVIGGTGNISTSIVKLLLEKGHEVSVFNRGISKGLPKAARLIKGDRRDRENYETRLKKEHFDAVIDMISFDRADAESSYRAFRDVGHFIQCSSIATYGTKFRWMPTSEDHPLEAITPYGVGKNEADRFFLEAYYREGFPITIIKPSLTYGTGLCRQISWEFGWLDRIRKGKPIILCDGNILIQFLHAEDAAKGFIGAIGKKHCLGQMYNLVERGFITWEIHHRMAMKVLGREVELVTVPMDTLMAIDKKKFSPCEEFFSFNTLFSGDKICRDIPEFRPSVDLETGMTKVVEYMDREGLIPDSDKESWEDDIIRLQRSVIRNYPPST